MSTKTKATHTDLDHILNYVDTSKGLHATIHEGGKVQVQQETDGKNFLFHTLDVSEVLHRADAEGKAFIQVNFKNGTKVLFTETLIGFKPQETLGLDMGRIPKVVTTPDLISVFEAIEESMGADAGSEQEAEILKKVYLAIISGGERVGFDLSPERDWLNRLLASKFQASA